MMDGKTAGLTGDELTHWENLVDSGIPWKDGVTIENIKKMKILDKVPVVYCIDNRDITNMASFVPAILKRVGGNIWEILDENEDEMYEQLTYADDNGILNSWGMYLRAPEVEYVNFFAKSRQLEQHREEKGKADVTPGRAARRAKAAENLQKSATQVRKRIERRTQGEKVMELKEVVHIPLKDVDRAKTDFTSLTGVVVRVNQRMGKVRVAVRSGLLQSWYQYHQLGRITGPGNDMELNGLSDAYNNWKSLKEISERAVARDQSAVGGQGHGIIKCKCKGECSNAKCPCKKACRLCTSACHKGNDKCVNHE